MSGLLDVNNTTQSVHALTLERVAALTDQHIIHVVPGTELRSHWDDPSYFTSAFPPIFPYGHGKHINARRRRKLPFHKWVTLLLHHCSRYSFHVGHCQLIIDAFRHMLTLSLLPSTSHGGSTRLRNRPFRLAAMTGLIPLSS